MLTASTLSPFSVSSVMIAWTHSYRIALPAFFAVSVLLATYRIECRIGSDHAHQMERSRRDFVYRYVVNMSDGIVSDGIETYLSYDLVCTEFNV